MPKKQNISQNETQKKEKKVKEVSKKETVKKKSTVKEVPIKETPEKKIPEKTVSKKETHKKKSNSNYIYVILLVLLLLILLPGIFFNKDKEKEPYKDKEIVLKDNELLYADYIYTLPDGWSKNDQYTNALNVIFNTTEEGVESFNGGIINIKKINSTGKDKDFLFKDTSFFQESLTSGNAYLNVGEGMKIEHNNTPIIVFPCEYTNGNNSKVLLAFMPENDEYFYNIQFYSNRVVDNVDELYFNYEGLNQFIEFLSTGVKVSK